MKLLDFIFAVFKAVLPIPPGEREGLKMELEKDIEEKKKNPKFAQLMKFQDSPWFRLLLAILYFPALNYAMRIVYANPEGDPEYDEA